MKQNYEELELDSSRATSQYNSNHFDTQMDSVVIKLQFDADSSPGSCSSDTVVEIPISGQECFKMTIK